MTREPPIGPASARRNVSVTMGARESREFELGPFRLTEARFPPREFLARHTHVRVTFAVMLEGSFDLLIGGRRLECPRGTIFTEPAGESHANAIGTGGALVMVAQPDPAMELPRSCAALLDRINHFDSRGITSIARRLVRELRHPDDVTPLEGQALTFEMLAVAARLDMNRKTKRDPPGWLRRVEALVHDRFRQPVEIGGLAKEAGVHPAHLMRAFRERYGVSPGRYVRRLRLDWAAEQLVASDQPLSRLAIEAGFADQAHFTRAFRRHSGLTPGRYRALRRL